MTNPKITWKLKYDNDDIFIYFLIFIKTIGKQIVLFI